MSKRIFQIRRAVGANLALDFQQDWCQRIYQVEALLGGPEPLYARCLLGIANSALPILFIYHSFFFFLVYFLYRSFVIVIVESSILLGHGWPRRNIGIRRVPTNIRLTGNPRLAWFLQQLLSRNHDRPDYPVEAIVRLH